MIRASLLVAFLAIALGISSAGAQDDYLSAVVEIYDVSKKLIGTGTVVSPSGHVLTAKHVLVMPGTGTHRLAVQVSFRSRNDLLSAELVAAHPFLDIAILKIRGGTRPAWPSLPVMLENDGVQMGESIRLIGHKIDGEELYVERNASIDNVSREGHFTVGRKVDRGASGGPAIRNGKVLGVIVETDFLERTLITPIWAATDYFSIVGVAFLNEGYAAERNTTADIIKRVSNYEAIFADILLDLDWTARLVVSDNGDDSMGVLSIGFGQKLRAQSTIDAKLIVAVAPSFKGPDAQEIAETSQVRGVFGDQEWLRPPESMVVFDNIDREIARLAPATGAQISSLDVRMRVEPEKLSGHIVSFKDKAALEQMRSFEICFNLRPTPAATDSHVIMEGEGSTCLASHAYLAQSLPEENF